VIPRRTRVNDMLSLRRTIIDARDALTRARHQHEQAAALLHAANLAIGNSSAALEIIVAIYNRLVTEYEPEEAIKRWTTRRSRSGSRD
jgi:ADP-heptose:LPS heptosyltransferase